MYVFKNKINCRKIYNVKPEKFGQMTFWKKKCTRSFTLYEKNSFHGRNSDSFRRVMHKI